MNKYRKFQLEYYKNPYTRTMNSRPLDELIEFREKVSDIVYKYRHGTSHTKYGYEMLKELRKALNDEVKQ